jgi:hypothetical protein
LQANGEHVAFQRQRAIGEVPCMNWQSSKAATGLRAAKRLAG